MPTEFTNWVFQSGSMVPSMQFFTTVERGGSAIRPAATLPMVPVSVLAHFATTPIRHGPDCEIPSRNFEVDCQSMVNEIANSIGVIDIVEDEPRFDSLSELTAAVMGTLRAETHCSHVAPLYSAYTELQGIPGTLLHSWELRGLFDEGHPCGAFHQIAEFVCSECGVLCSLSLSAIRFMTVEIEPCADGNCGYCPTCAPDELDAVIAQDDGEHSLDGPLDYC